MKTRHRWCALVAAAVGVSGCVADAGPVAFDGELAAAMDPSRSIASVPSASASIPTARTCYVGAGPEASDDHPDPYRRNRPFATVAAVLARGRADCGTITLLDGIYRQRIVIVGNHPGPGEGWLTVRAEHPFVEVGEPPRDSLRPAWPPLAGALVDGGGAPVDGALARQAAVAIYDSSYVRIEGLRLRDDANRYCTSFPRSRSACNNAGIDVRNRPGVTGASSHHVVIDGNQITGVVAARLPTGGTSAVPAPCTGGGCTRKYDSTPVAVYSDRNTADGATHHVELIDNVIQGCDPNSDSNGVPLILISSNVENVLVQGNTLRGAAASAAVPQSPGITVRGERFGVSSDPSFDRARSVVIRGNVFAGTTGPAVSVQSAHHVLVERNTARATQYGFQVTTEGIEAQDAGPAEVTWARQVWIRDNLIVDAGVWAIDAGQVAASYSPVRDVFVTNNTIASTPGLLPSPSVGRIALVLRAGVTGDSVFASNLVALGLAGNGGCQWASPYTGCDYAVLAYDAGADQAFVVDHNLWHAPPDERGEVPLFCFQPPVGPLSCEVHARFQAAGHDVHGQFAEPAFGRVPYLPTWTSPALDGGRAAIPRWLADGGASFGDYVGAYGNEPASFPERDHRGQPRTPGPSGEIDVGMYEVSP